MTINSTTRKTNPFTGNGSAHTFPFTFKVFTDADIVVKKLEASTSIETTLTLGLNNDYIVTLNADQNSNPGGSVTLKSGGNNQTLANGFSLVITSDVEALQGTDLTNQGGFFPEVINDALDKAIIIHQQQQTELDRSIRFSLTNSIGSLEITENAATRANKVLGFDNLGEFNIVQELGTYRGNWTAGRAYVVRDLVKDTNTNNIFMCNAAHTSSGAQPLTTNTDSAKWDLIVDAATATTSSTNAASSATAAANSATAAANSANAAASSQTAAASSATTASTKATQADTAKTAAQTAQTAAETAKTAAETALDSFDDRYLGAKSSNPTLDNDGNALIDGALYFNTTVNRMRVYDLGNTTWLEVTISGSDLTNTNTVAGAISNVNAVGGNISNVNAVASNATNINAVNSNSSNINTVAGAASNISTVSGSIANVNTVGGGIANVNTVAAEINNNKLQTVANNINSVVTAANDLNEATSEIDTVANNITNVNNVGNNISNVNSVAGIASNVTAVAGNASNVNTVAGAITNVNNVGGSIANVNTVASNLSGVNSFAERYRTDNTGNNPSTSLNAGDLFYNQASGKLLVYNGVTSAWEETQSVGNFFINTISSFSGTGGNSATFNGSAYKFTLSNAGQFAQQMLVSINGVVQKPNTGTSQPSEGFALDGANIIFSAAPPTGSDFFIVTIGASVSIGTPSDNTVTSAKIVDGTILGSDLATNIDLADNQKLRFGASQDLQIYHTGSHTFIENSGTGNLIIESQNTTGIRGGVVNLTNVAGNANLLVATAGGSVDLYHDNAKKFETTSSGVKGYGTGVGHIFLGDFRVKTEADANFVTFKPGESLVRWHDNHKAVFGASNDLQLYHDGTDSYCKNSTGQLKFLINDNENAIIAHPNSGVELYADNTKRFETGSLGARFFGNLYASDNYKLLLGNSQDLEIYHASNISTIKDNYGDLRILSNTLRLQPLVGNENFLYAIEGGTTRLFYDGATKFETTSTGVTVTGNTLAVKPVKTIVNTNQGHTTAFRFIISLPNTSRMFKITGTFSFSGSGSGNIYADFGDWSDSHTANLEGVSYQIREGGNSTIEDVGNSRYHKVTASGFDAFNLEVQYEITLTTVSFQNGNNSTQDGGARAGAFGFIRYTHPSIGCALTTFSFQDIAASGTDRLQSFAWDIDASSGSLGDGEHTYVVEEYPLT